MQDDQTLTMYSGHPMGYLHTHLPILTIPRLFPSHKDAPRVVITNGMVIPNYSTRDDYERMYAQGVTMYGQMTAGSYCCMFTRGENFH